MFFTNSLNQDGPNQNSSSTFTVMQSNQTSERDDFILKNELKIIADIFDPIQVKTLVKYYIELLEFII